MPIAEWNKYGLNKKCKDFGNLVIDMNNFIYRSKGFPCLNPMISFSRVKYGYKLITFKYLIAKSDIAHLIKLNDYYIPVKFNKIA